MDPFSKKAKIEGYRARSIYKLKELNKKYNLIRQRDRVLDIGSYPGSWLQACKELKASFILGVDKIPIISISGVKFIQEDINNNVIFEKIEKISDAFDVVISDIAPKTSGNLDQEKSLDLSKRAYEIAIRFLRPRGNFLCKVFQTKELDDFVKIIKKDFEFAKITKPSTSKKRSYEVYIVAKNFKLKL